MQAFSYINVVTYLSFLILIMSWSCNVYCVSLPPVFFTIMLQEDLLGQRLYTVLQLLFLSPDYCRVSDMTEWLSLIHSLTIIQEDWDTL